VLRFNWRLIMAEPALIDYVVVHELAHLRTIDETIDHGPRWEHQFHTVARPAFGPELRRDI